jgi:hypothetical protein
MVEVTPAPAPARKSTIARHTREELFSLEGEEEEEEEEEVEGERDRPCPIPCPRL